MLGWMKHKLESRLLGEISITSDLQMTPPLWQKVKKNLMKVKEESQKVQHSENKDHGIQSHHFMANRGRNSGNSGRLCFGGSKTTADGDCSHEIKRHLQLGKNLPAMQETWVRFLGRQDPLEKGMATHSSILAWRIPWTIPWRIP